MKGSVGMKPKPATKLELYNLALNFLIVASHYKLSQEVAKTAWDSATRSPIKSSRCYAAIARSL